MSTYKIGYIIGSLAKESINRKLAQALVKLAPENLELTEISIGDLPLYSYDYDADYPAEGKALKDALAGVDAVLVITPEYNRGVPAALKNAIEWASRPWGTNSFDGKPLAIIGTSGGGIGTAVVQQQLRAIFLHLNATVQGQPEGYIQTTEGLINENSEVTVESTKEFLAFWMKSYADFVAKQLS